MSILKLAAMLTLDGTHFKAGLAEAEAASNRFGKQVKNNLASAFGATALAFAVKGLVDYNSKVKDTATALDISTDALQEQAFWITQNSGTVEDLALAYKGLALARADALKGGKKMSLFEAMGIGKDELSGSSIESLFKRVAEGFRTTDFGGDKMGAAQGLFGKGAMAIMPALEQSMSDAADEARRLGQVIDKDVNTALEQMGDRIDAIGGALKNIGSVTLLGAIKGVDLGITTLGMGLLGIEQQALRFLHAILATVGQIPGMSTPGIQEKLRAMDAEAGMASGEMFNAMLDRYDPSKSGSGKRKGAGLFSDEEGESKATRDSERARTRMEDAEQKLWELSIKRLDVTKRVAAMEGQIAEMKKKQAAYMDRISNFEIPSDEEHAEYVKGLAARMEVEDAIKELLETKKSSSSRSSSSSATLSAGSLTQVGQWSGRNLIGTGGSGGQIKDVVAEQAKTTKAVNELKDKIKAKTIVAGV